MSAYVQAIWSLVSGLEPRRAKLRHLCMLQAFIDESLGDDLIVMGGLIAPPEKWAQFTVDWRLVCEMPLRLEYFKMSEAYKLSGQFLGFSKARRDERLTLLHETALKYVSGGVLIVMRKSSFDQYVSQHAMDLPQRSWYYFLLFSLVEAIGKRAEELGITEHVDFIFDDQVMFKGTIVDAWDANKQISKYKDIIGDSPSFKDDKSIIPLQAADLVASGFRYQLSAEMRGDRFVLPTTAAMLGRDVPWATFIWTKESLMRYGERLIRIIRAAMLIQSAKVNPGRLALLKDREPDQHPWTPSEGGLEWWKFGA